MAEIRVDELKRHASRVIDEIADGRSYVITKRGRPAAVIMPIEEAEDLVLANAEECIAMRRRGRDDYRRGRTVSLSEIG